MPIDSADINPLARRKYISVPRMNGLSVDLLVTGGAAAAGTDTLTTKSSVLSKEAATDAQLVGAIAATDRNARLRGIGNGNPRLVPLSTLKMSGLLVTLANDGIEFCEMIPEDLDYNQPIGVRTWWTSEAAAVSARTITWKALYAKFADLDVLAAGSVALDTPIAAQAPAGVALTLQKGDRGVINARKLATTNTLATGVAFWSFLVTMSAFHASFTEAKYLLGLEIDYTARLALGRRSIRAATRKRLED